MTRIEWYSNALRSLGLTSLLRLQIQKARNLDEGQFMHLTARGLAFPVIARARTSDLYVFDQIFVELQYRCLDHLAPRLILDCGANVGYSSAYFLSRFPHSHVVAVEPEPNNFSVLRRNIVPYGNRCDAVQAAIWPSPRQLHLVAASQGNEWGFSVASNGSGNAAVQAVTIPMLIEGSGFERISILKIDIEGAERELFSTSFDWLDRVDNIVIELHDDECKRIFFEAIKQRDFAVSHYGELTICLGKGA